MKPFEICSIPLKLPSLFVARHFWTFHNKLHNMKALVILSHHDHHFYHLLVFMKKKNFCGSLWALLEYFPEKKLPTAQFQYGDLCPNWQLDIGDIKGGVWYHGASRVRNLHSWTAPGDEHAIADAHPRGSVSCWAVFLHQAAIYLAHFVNSTIQFHIYMVFILKLSKKECEDVSKYMCCSD